MQFYRSLIILTLYLVSRNIISVKCKDYNTIWDYRKNIGGTTNPDFNSKHVAKAMLDLKYQHKNASLGNDVLFTYKDLIKKLSQVRGYKLDYLKKYRSHSEQFSKYYTQHWPKLRHRIRKKKWGYDLPIRKMPILSNFKSGKSQKGRQGEDGKNGIDVSSEFDPEFSPYSIAGHLKTLPTHFPQANITQEVIGRTVSYNDIVLWKVTECHSKVSSMFRTAHDESKYVLEGPEKKAIFIVHGLTVMGFKNVPCLIEEEKFVKLLRLYFVHLPKFDIYLIPMANPDGLAMPQKYWNKNASPQDACSGVALDRNFDVAWNGSKIISSCSQQFPGPTAFSEEESKAIREVLHQYHNKIVAYIHVHAGTYNADIFKGDALLYPKGYTDSQSDDDKYIDLRGEVDEALKSANFQILTVTVDNLFNWYGQVSGTSVDYAATIYGIPYAMEYVMQIYNDDVFAQSSHERETNVALEEVWGRVINVTFDCVYKSLHVFDDTANNK